MPTIEPSRCGTTRSCSRKNQTNLPSPPTEQATRETGSGVIHAYAEGNSSLCFPAGPQGRAREVGSVQYCGLVQFRYLSRSLLSPRAWLASSAFVCASVPASAAMAAFS